jgi:hypothetical protein
MTKEEALNTARGLVQEAVEVANRAGIDASDVVAPHCAETQGDGNAPGAGKPTWCGLPVIIDNDTEGLFEMSEPDDDPEQQPAFLVTQSTADLVRQDFERYQPSLERMVADWQEAKKRCLFEETVDEDKTGI